MAPLVSFVQIASNITAATSDVGLGGNPALLANLIARVLLAFVGTVLCWVPLVLLWRNGEFAAAVLIVDVMVMNVFTIINSVIWNSDDVSNWFDGTGLCDIQVYLQGPLRTIYSAAIFTVMYHLSTQVKVSRATRLGQREKTIRNRLQAAIIFPLAIFQLAFTWFDIAQRYIIGTLVGCTAVYDNSWPKTLIYDAPPAVFAVLTVPYAILLWKRFHTITKRTQGMVKSGSMASISAVRTRRRLYKMSLAILVVYLPLMIFYLVVDIKSIPSYKPYDYYRIHWAPAEYPWDSTVFVASWSIPSAVLNQPWIPIATTVPIVAFFGMTTEALETQSTSKSNGSRTALSC
ncbi:GPCR fungal pheromone mating factor [Xylariaceae sp. FL0255]|nr:GPCR fungal pheromone mating factor [Xylariaceae sp. FL0255]